MTETDLIEATRLRQRKSDTRQNTAFNQVGCLCSPSLWSLSGVDRQEPAKRIASYTHSLACKLRNRIELNDVAAHSRRLQKEKRRPFRHDRRSSEARN
jgi:hypothetical protein